MLLDGLLFHKIIHLSTTLTRGILCLETELILLASGNSACAQVPLFCHNCHSHISDKVYAGVYILHCVCFYLKHVDTTFFVSYKYQVSPGVLLWCIITPYRIICSTFLMNVLPTPSG